MRKLVTSFAIRTPLLVVDETLGVHTDKQPVD